MKNKKIKTKKPMLIATFAGALLIVGFGATLAVALVSMEKKPNNAPEKFIVSTSKSRLTFLKRKTITQERSIALKNQQN